VKIHIIVLGRLKSQRLPRKAVRQLNEQYNMSTFLLARMASLCDDIPNLCLSYATSNLHSDIELRNSVSAAGFNCYMGDPNNVILRMLECDDSVGPSDFILRVTADNPFTCPYHLRKLIALASTTSLDYSIIPDLNTGFRSEIISRSYLESVLNSVQNPNCSEYMTFMLDRPDKCNVVYLQPDIHLNDRKFCFTVDTFVQYEYVRQLVMSGCHPLSTYKDIFTHAYNLPNPCLDFKRYSRATSDTLVTHQCSWKGDC
jgi:spore coat polysaccharide biosynthesis protein SpsF (cytidylyltransferase family)